MSEKSNFYVFERKEIFLVILFVILVSVTSFLFGLKMGSSYSFDKGGNSSSELEAISTETSKVDFASTEEESVDKMMGESQTNQAPVKNEDINKRVEESLKQKLVDEFSTENNKKFQGTQTETANTVNSTDTQGQEASVVESTAASEEVVQDTAPKKDNLSGKYTIQLGSYQTLKEATDFAEGFKVLGYTPIVNEVQISGRGNWFRVSLGIFGNLNDAKNYLVKNKTLFTDRDYVIIQFD